MVFNEDVLHAERGVVIVKTEGGGEGDVVVESVGFRHLGLHLERRLLGELVEGSTHFVVEHVETLLTVEPHLGEPLKSEESIVLHLHGFGRIGALCLVHGDDNEGHALDVFAQSFEGFHAEGANSAPCAGAFFDDLHTRIEHIVIGIGVRFYCCLWGRCCCRCTTLCCGSATHDGGK